MEISFKFIGLLHYYPGVWSIWSHILEPLTELTSNKVKSKWTEIKQKVSKEIKLIVAHNNLSAYPDFNKNLEMHRYDIYSQLGAVISQ